MESVVFGEDKLPGFITGEPHQPAVILLQASLVLMHIARRIRHKVQGQGGPLGQQTMQR